MGGERGAPVRVLLADDAEDLRMLLRVTLEKDGRFVVVAEAADGLEAVELARREHVDAVVLDLSMPVMDGLQALPHIRAELPEAKIVVLSGFNASQMSSEALSLGADAYLEKGVAFKRLVTVLLGDEAARPAPAPVEASTAATDGDPARSEPARAAVAAATGAPDIRSAFEGFGHGVRELVDFDRMSFWIATASEASEFECVAVWGPSGWRLGVGSRLQVTGKARRILKGQPLLEPDTAEDTGEVTNSILQDRGIRSYVGVPVIVDGRPAAIISFASERPNAFTHDDVPLLSSLVAETAGIFHVLLLLDEERKATERLRESGRLRDDMVGMVAHDLKSPLTVIGGFAEHLKEGWSSLPEDKKLEALEVISRNINDVSQLVEDMAELASIEAGSFRCEAAPFDLAGLVEATVNDLTVSYPGRKADVSVPDDLPHALGDVRRQRQVLANLLCNALKFSAPSSSVEVVISRTRDTALVAVRDEGPGIDRDHITRVFEKFYRVGGNRKVPGRGLGLYICKLLVEAQDGQIWADSEPGEGSTFVYTIPLAAAD